MASYVVCEDTDGLVWRQLNEEDFVTRLVSYQNPYRRRIPAFGWFVRRFRQPDTFPMTQLPNRRLIEDGRVLSCFVPVVSTDSDVFPLLCLGGAFGNSRRRLFQSG